VVQGKELVIVLELLKELFRVWKIVNLTLKAGNITTTMLALQNIDKQIDALADQYAKLKGASIPVSGKTDEILSALDQLIVYLNKVAYRIPRLPPVTANSAAVYALTMQEAIWARLLLTKIYSLQDDQKLPAPKMPWSRRRVMLVNQRDALIRLGMQMEGAIRRTDEDIVESGRAEDAIRRAAWDPIITPEEQVMLNDDWTSWANTEREAREWKARFSGVLEFTKKNIEALSQIIEAGDRKQKK
jgi:hypothetical protein